MDEEMKVCVAMSRKWKGEEIANEIIQQIKEKTPDPKFILLFSTIHHKNEFKPMLEGIKKEFPNVPLIGGTVAGFMNQEGVFTRGVCGLTLEYLDMDINVGIGQNTKRNPEGAVKQIVKKLEKNKKYENNVIIEILPTAVIPKIPILGQKNVIFSELLGNNLVKLMPLITKFNLGYDRADEIIELLSENFKDRTILGGCSMDDNKMLNSYQFYNEKIKNNDLIAMNISLNKNIKTETIIGFKVLSKKFRINKRSKDRHVIHKMNNEGARSALFKEIKFEIKEKEGVYQLYKKAFYYPLGFKKNNILHAGMIGLIYGENLIFANRIDEKEIYLLSLSIEELLKNLDEGISRIMNEQTSFILGFGCETFIETLGNSNEIIKIPFDKTKKPFLVVFLSGESIYTPNLGAHHLYESMNILSF